MGTPGGRKRGGGTAPILGAVMLLHCCCVAVMTDIAPWLEASPPSTLVYSDIANKKTNYSLRVHGRPFPNFTWYERDLGSQNWVIPNDNSIFQCTLRSVTDQDYGEYLLFIDHPPPNFKDGHISLQFTNSLGFAMCHLEIKASADLIPPQLQHDLLVASASAGVIIVITCLIAFLRRCCIGRRRRHRRRFDRAQGQINSSVECNAPANSPQNCNRRMLLPRPQLQLPRENVKPPSSTPTTSHQPSCSFQHAGDPMPLPSCTPPSCPCSRGYIRMKQVAEAAPPSDKHADLADAITSTLNRFRARKSEQSGPSAAAGSLSLMRSRRVSRSVPSLLFAYPTDSPTLARLRRPSPPPKLKSSQGAGTIGYGQFRHYTRPRLEENFHGSKACTPPQSWQDDDLGGFTSFDARIQRSPAGVQDILRCRRAQAEDMSSLEELDDVLEENSHRDSEKYMTMRRFERGSRLPGDCGHNRSATFTSAVLHGPVYMNLLGLYGERGGEEGAGGPP
ncbi:uncharacterized protein LOC143287300 [Babylonia areolata]|uniref:uncharacterized protein LOC143287300 n=1 Tax=Babylonia areolata TaxID=304850 RepID=UPI003FD5E99A